MNSGKLQKAFDDFALASFGDISKQQYIALRRTFIAGAVTMFSVAMTGLSDVEEVTAKDLDMMADLRAELLEFNEAVKAGTK